MQASDICLDLSSLRSQKSPPDSTSRKRDYRGLSRHREPPYARASGSFFHVCFVGKNTKIHGVGDGAPWIAEQIDEQFGINGSYLIDFYHLCDYLAAAASFCAPQKQEAWTKEQKLLLKQSKSHEVLINLKPYLETKDIDDKEASVRACYRYIENRPKQFDYKNAIDNDLPIGSGEVESAHRYIHQKRMKISGAWWLKEKAGYMMSLSTLSHAGYTTKNNYS